jgi:pyridoxal phosphate enzyme (YggS family)
MITIEHNITATRARINNAADTYDRKRSTISLLAVSKKQSVEAIQQAVAAGLIDFGENYLQEAEQKIQQLQSLNLTWHYIGGIQSNKTQTIARLFNWVHSVDRIKLARRLSDQRPMDMPPLNICLQVNIDNEPGKSGFNADHISAAVTEINSLPRLQLRGLMAIPAQSDNVAKQRDSFSRMRTLYDSVKDAIDSKNDKASFDTLSMGMSADLEPAIAEGATIVRVGTDIFGPRDRSV